MRTSKPNLIYILADDMGYGDFGCNNPGSKIPTPNLDRLAQQGMRFTDAHASASVCTPSRYSILTGRHCWRTPLKSGVLWPWDPPLIEPDRLTVASLLREHGYRTECLGKWHLGWAWGTKNGRPAHEGVEIGDMAPQLRHAMEANIDYRQPLRGGPVDCGFDHYFGIDVPNFPPYTWFEDDHLTDLPTVEKPDSMYGLKGLMKPGWVLEEMIPEFTRRAVKYIEGAGAGSEPFYLHLTLTSPHTPIVPNQQFIGKSGAGLYGDFVCEVDWVVGEVMAALERKGIADHTLVIFTSDNGPEGMRSAAGGCYEVARLHRHYSMGHLRGIKRDTWEGGHRVPFLVRWPGVTPSGTTCDQLVGLGDLIATCAQMLDVKLPADKVEDSIGMLPLLQGKTDAPTRDFMIHHSNFGRFALRQGDWVFIDAPTGDDWQFFHVASVAEENREPDWFKKERGYRPHDFPGELYDLRQDISERENLYGKHPEVVEELSRKLHEMTRAAREPGSCPMGCQSE